MPKSSVNASLSSYDDIFSTEESRQEEQREQVRQIPIGELFPFKNHPFKVLDDDSMSDTVESVKQYGVLSPLIARPRPKGGYEIISGHRRQHAAELAGLETLPVIVRQMDDDAAIILMVDSNLQREHILPSERAFAYKMKLDAMKNQGTRSDLTSTQVVSKLRSNEKLGAENNQSRETVRRFIRLTNLIPELLDMVDNKTVSFNPAVELSYLSPEQQQEVIRAMDDTQNFPSVSQAKRIKKLAQDGTFTTETVVAIMGEEKKSELDTVTIKNQGARSDLTSPQVASKFRSDDEVAKGQGISGDTVRRFIRLTNLIPELLDMEDNKTVSFNPAVELSYLSPEQQQEVMRAMDDTQNFPSVSQAKRIKKLAQVGTFTTETVVDIMGEAKRSALDTVTIQNDTMK